MRKRTLFGSLIGAGAAVVALLLWAGGVLDRLENTTWAWRVHASVRPSPATPNIKLILLDQASLDWGSEQNGWSWPWPREVYAPILDFCRRGGARVVAFDVLFTEPSVYGVSDDEALEAAIRRTPPRSTSPGTANGSGRTCWTPGGPSRKASQHSPCAWKISPRS